MTSRIPLAFFRRSTSGFSFIEILVVTVIMIVLSSIIIVSYQGATVSARDGRRKRDMAALQAALEGYKQVNGSYPVSTGCGGNWTWPGCTTDWIPGLKPTYMPILPTDPRNTANQFIGNTLDALELYTYNYRQLTTGTYLLITRLERSTDPSINGSQFSAYGITGESIYVVTEPK